MKCWCTKVFVFCFVCVLFSALKADETHDKNFKKHTVENVIKENRYTFTMHKVLLQEIKDPQRQYQIGMNLLKKFSTENPNATIPFYEGVVYGGINILIAPAEIVRAFCIEPNVAIISGPSRTIARFSQGVVDFVTLGFFTDRLYSDDIPHKLWNAAWTNKVSDNIIENQTIVFEYDKLAFDWIGKAAYRGHGGAQYVYGSFFERGIGGQKKDMLSAVKWYERAKINGEDKAKTKLKSIRGF